MRDEYDFSKGKRGAVIASPGKTRITIMLDDDVIEAFRSRAENAGTGYQTLINAALREAIAAPKDKPLTGAISDRRDTAPGLAARTTIDLNGNEYASLDQPVCNTASAATAMDRQARCPLCGRSNACAMAASGGTATSCWCTTATFSKALLDRVPEADRGVSCICAACTAAAAPAG